MNNKRKIKRFVYIFLALIALLGTQLIMKNSDNSKPMIVSMFWKKSYKTLDPAKISYINEAIIIDNLYRNLITFDNYGNIVADLVDTFYWDGMSYVFQISGTKLTSNGNPITVEDALLSLKRLMILDKNNHGRLKKYICGAEEIKKLDDHCSGLKTKGDLLFVTPNKKISKDLLLNLFTGIDFKVLQKNSFELSPPYLIFDYSNTTGAYFVDKSSDLVEATFQLNKHFENVNSGSPKTWKIKSSELTEKVSNVGRGIDLITTASIINWENFQLDNSEFSLFKTLPIAIELVAFSKKGQRDFSIYERAFAVDEIRNFLLDKVEKNKEKTYQFFPKDSVGFIGKDDEDKIVSIFKEKIMPKNIIKIGFPKSLIKTIGDYSILKKLNIEIVEFELSSYSVDSVDVDAVYTQTDTAVQEELSLLEYNFNFGIFGLGPSESSNWLNNYVTKERSERIKILKDFHFEVLSGLKLAPLYAMPYFAITTKNWQFKMSNQSASTKIWQIQSKSLAY